MSAPGKFRELLPRLALLIVPLLLGGIAYGITNAVGLPPARCVFWTVVVFVVALLVVLGVLLAGWMRRRMKAGRLEDSLASGTGRYDQKGEIEALRKNWKESVGKLKGTAVGGGGSRALAMLPWYVIMGAPASGKSTLLRQSGIDFPVGDAAIKGLQGTRNCDWWFSNVGVFLDTAGRYMSDEHADEWAQFLDLVRRHRTAAPINGVIVAIPAADIIERSDAEQEMEARRIRARLDELIDHLGVNFPVWIVLTKVDLVGGFVEFFGNADAATRQQMMGWTVEQDEGARFNQSLFERRWTDLIHKLRELRPLMVGAAKLRDRPAAFGFPDELAALGEPFGRMMARLFEPNVYQETPLYRGFYVTSATQQGTPLQRAASRVRQLLGAPAVDADAQGVLIKNAYFVKDLMRERIVLDHGMTWTTQHEIERGKLKRLGMNLTASSLGVFGFLAVLAAGTCARHDMEAVEASLRDSRKADESVLARCEGLFAQQRQATFGVWKNLGLSLPLPLQKEMADREAGLYRTEIVGALLESRRKAIETADVTGAGGLAPLVAAYRDYLVTASALKAIAAAKTAPPAATKSPPPEPPKEGAAPPDPNDLPPGVLSPDEMAALTARAEELVAAGILPKAGTDTPERKIARLLSVAWRNGGIDETAAKAMESVDAAFDARVADYLRRVRAALDSRSAISAGTSAQIDSRRTAFLKECAHADLLLQSANVPKEKLRRELEAIAATLATEPAPAGPGPAASADLSILGSVAESLKALADAKVRTDAQLAAIEGYAAVRQYAQAEADRVKSGAAAPQAEASGRMLTALDTLAKATAELLAEGPTSPAERRTWQVTIGMSEATIALDATFRSKQGPWAQTVVQQLLPLVEGSTAETLQRHPVIRLGEALRLERMLEEFVTDPDGFASYAQRIETARRPPPGIADLDKDLAQLAAPLDLGAKNRLVSEPLLKAIEARVADSFGVVVTTAESQWSQRIRAETADTGSWRSCIDAWADPAGAIGRLAALVTQNWGEDRVSRFDADTAGDSGAAAIWRAKLAKPIARYRAFVAGVASGSRAADELRKCAGRDVSEASLAEFATKLGRSAASPAWRQPGAVDRLPEDGPFGDAKAALVAALAAGEEDLVTRLRDWFNRNWSLERQRIEAALKSPSPESTSSASQAMARMRGAFVVFFGDSLADTPGRRLELPPEFVGRFEQAAATLGPGAFDEITVTIECVAVPTSQSDKGFPLVEVEYKQQGKAPATEKWLPNAAKQLSFTFAPNKGEYFTIRMRNERTNDSKTFRAWTTPDCVVAALTSGLGTSSDALDWEGTGEFKGDHAKFRLVTANADRIRRLNAAPEDTRLPETCVRILPR